MMRAARYHGIGDVRLDEVEKPVCAPGDVLVDVAYAGICGSDLHVYGKGMFGIEPPMTMGHELSGVVEAVGEDVTAVKPGDHVIADPRLGCGRCEWCHRGEYHLCAELAFIGEARPGSYADYVLLPERHLVPVSPSLEMKVAALVEPTAVAVHTVGLVSDARDRTVGIIGAGPVGLLTLVVARSMPGWRVAVVDKVRSRRELAAELGAERVAADAEELGERWADIVVEAAGKAAALTGGLRWLRPGGVMALVGIYEDPVTLDPTDVVVKEARLVGVSAYEHADLVQAAVVLENETAAARRVISDVLPLEQAKQGLEMCRTGSAGGKVLLDCRKPATTQVKG